MTVSLGQWSRRLRNLRDSRANNINWVIAMAKKDEGDNIVVTECSEDRVRQWNKNAIEQ